MPHDPAAATRRDHPSAPAEATSDQATTTAVNSADTPDPVAVALRSWQRELADLGGPNSLLWFDGTQTTLELTHAHPGGLAIFLSDRPTVLSDMVRERTAFADALARALVIRNTAHRLREEHGLTTCLLAAGIARLPLGARTLAAPVLLRTCELVPVDAAERDLQLVVGDAVEVNPALVDLLARLGVTLDADAIAARARTRNGFDPTLAHRELLDQAHAAGLGALEVDPRLLITTFTYSKATLAADLAENGRAWSRHRLLRVAAGEELDVPPALAPDADPTGLVLDLDDTQARAVTAVRAGHDLVLDAPATTGGTQTVAAALAALAGDGRTALLVGSAREGLAAVVDRLATVGLDDLVLTVDDDPRTRRRAVQAVLAALDAPVPDAPEPDARHVLDLRARLADQREALHAVREPWGVSAFQAQAAVATLCEHVSPPVSRVRLDPDTLRTTTHEKAVATGRVLTQAAERGAWRGGSTDDPWFGARITSAEEARTAGLVLRRLTGPEGIDRAEGLVHALCTDAHLTPGDSVAQWRADIDVIASVRHTTELFTQDVYDANLPELLAVTSSTYRELHGPQLGFWRRLSRRRTARSLLRPGPAPADLHAELAAAHSQAVLWRERSGPAARPHQAQGIDAARAAVDGVRADLAWLEPRLQGTVMGDAIEQLPVDRLREHLARLQERLDRAAVVPAVGAALDGVRAAGFGALLDDFARRDLPADRVGAEVEFVWWSSVLDAVRAADPRYGEHDGTALHRTREQYRAADVELLAATAARVRHDVRAAARRAAATHADQVERLRAELARPEMPRPLADLWRDAGDVLAAAYPVWACSPAVVPAVVGPESRADVVVVLDAEQVSPALAASALARGRSALVVGDPDGLAPVPYRVAAGSRGIDDDITLVRAGDSLLDAVHERLPVLALRVAYGRADERLDRAVGARDRVHVPVSGGPEPTILERVSAPRAGQELVSPDAEIDRVVRLVLAHLRAGDGRSIGVVTFAAHHAERIDAALRAEITHLDAGAPELRGLDALPESLIVVPAHRLAGRMRDVVLLAPGYAVGEEGASTHRFGVVSLPGGERIVGVAAAAARSSLVLVTSLTCADLGLAREPLDGVARLRALLDAVESAQENAVTAPTRAATTPADPLLADLAARLRSHGLAVRSGVGEPGRQVDLAVSTPRRLHHRPVAVLGDGPGTAAVSTRERERLWPQLLESRGWRVVHVCSTDLFAAPEPEAARVAGALGGVR